jgi:hypothetical protein
MKPRSSSLFAVLVALVFAGCEKTPLVSTYATEQIVKRCFPITNLSIDVPVNLGAFVNCAYEDNRLLFGFSEEPYYSHRELGSLVGLRFRFESEHIIGRCGVHTMLPFAYMEGAWNSEDEQAKADAGIVTDDFSRREIDGSLQVRVDLTSTVKVGFTFGYLWRDTAFEYYFVEPQGDVFRKSDPLIIDESGSFTDSRGRVGIFTTIYPRLTEMDVYYMDLNNDLYFTEWELGAGFDIYHYRLEPYLRAE